MTKIELQIIDHDSDHVLLTFERPGRAELSIINGTLVLHVYDGAEVDPDQEPLGGYLGEEYNTDWSA